MSGPVASLLWKEWHEQRWKLAFGCVICMGMALIGTVTRVMPDVMVLMVAGMWSACLLPLFTVMGVFSAEWEDCTRPFLMGLPRAAMSVYLSKTGMGLVATFGPILGIGLIVAIMGRGRELMLYDVAQLTTKLMFIAFCWFVWMAFLSMRQPTEARAGMVALATLAGHFFCYIVVYQIARGVDKPRHPVLALSPVSFLPNAFKREYDFIWVACVQLVICAVLLVWAGRRFARIPRRGK